MSEYSDYLIDPYGANPPSPADMLPTLDVETWLINENDKSIAFIALWGANKTVMNTQSSTIYKVTSGSGRFYFPEHGKPPQKVHAGYPIRIDAYTVYRDAADPNDAPMMMLATSTPPFDREAEVKV